jgi:hypothetical protein
MKYVLYVLKIIHIFFSLIPERREQLSVAQKVDPGPEWGGDDAI